MCTSVNRGRNILKIIQSAKWQTRDATLSGFNRDQYEQMLLTMSVSQKKLLIALANERTGEFDDGYRNRHSLGVSSTVNSAKAKLMEDGHIELSSGQYAVADPFFAQFLRTA